MRPFDINLKITHWMKNSTLKYSCYMNLCIENSRKWKIYKLVVVGVWGKDTRQGLDEWCKCFLLAYGYI
jgi:hypothetical protein